MFFVVTSQNRHAVRKVLTHAGHDSSKVRVMRNGELGQALFDACKAGSVTEQQARAACQAQEPDAVSEAAEAAIAPVVASSNGHAVLPADAAAALRTLLGVEAPKVDEAAMRRIAAKIVREQLVEAGQRPAVIEIRTDGIKTGEVSGKTHHRMFNQLVTIVSTRVAGRRLHVWLAGPSASGKSTLVFQIAQVLKLDYYSTSAIQSKYDLIGFVPPNFNGEAKECHTLMTAFRRAFEFGGVFAWDDIDGSDPRAFVAFNEALSNGRFAFPDRMVEAHPDFVCIASANTWGNGATADYVGRNKIDGATLSRFVRVLVDYDERLERDMVGEEYAEWAKFVQAVRKAVTKEGIKVLVTPRHTLQGAALLHAGIPRPDVEGMTLFAGLDGETVTRLRAAA